MRNIILLFICFFFNSCVTKEKKERTSNEYSPEILQQGKEIADSIIQNATKEALFDTIGLSNSPIKVLSARLIRKEYSNFKDISITFKNVSNKRIEGIRFRWYGINAFNEPADMGSYGYSQGFGSGFTDTPISPGKAKTSEWGILSKDGKKIILAWAYEVVFSDGSKWKCGK